MSSVLVPRKRYPSFLPCAILLLHLLCMLPAGAQTTAGQIAGQITDITQSVIAGVTVTAVQLSTGRTTTATTDNTGLYVLPSLPLGTYRITANHQGFAPAEGTVTLDVNQNIRFNLTLKVGSQVEEVDVSSGAASLETTNAAVTATFETAQIAQLPINGRDYGRFSLLTPGAVLRTSQIADITFDGMESTNNQFTIDGIDATRVDGAYMANGSERGARLLTGSLDTIAEFKTLSNSYTADYGRASGGIVNIVTKSGTNGLHGSAYDFFRNDYMDATNYFQPPGTPAPKRFNDFGANVAGPIRRDRMFYFANYEGTRQSIGLVGGGTVLSPAKQTSLEASEPALTPIIASMPAPGSASPYIHGVVLSPTSDPNVDAISFAATNRVQENLGSLRLDNNWSSKDTSFVRYNTNYSLVNGPLIGVYPTAFGLQDHQLVSAVTTNIAISETHVFSPALLNNFLAGMQEYITAFNEVETLPTITIGGLTYSPGNRGLYGREPRDIQYSDTVTWVKGHHTLAMGAGVWNVSEPFHGYISAPSVSFASLSAFYANQVNSASISATFPNNTTKMAQVGTFVMDTWQLKPNVALSLGLRWDWNQVPNDNIPTSVWSMATNSLTPVGSSFFNPYYKNFSPRIGIAWSPKSTMVVRAGYGIYDEAFQIGSFYNEITNTTPGTTTLSNANIPGLSYPVTPYLGSATTALPSLAGFQPTPRTPANNQWTLNIGDQLTSKTTLVVAYVGNSAHRLSVPEGVNYVNPVTGVRPYPQYSNITVTTWAGDSNYNAAQVELRQAMAKGLLATADFTYSHALSNQNDGGLYSQNPQQPFNLKAEYGNASNDVRENLSLNFLYDLPFGNARQFFAGSSGVTGRVISGWSLSGLAIVHSGIASTVYLSGNTYGNGDTTNQRPNRVPGVNIHTAQHGKTSNNTVPWLNFAAFSQPTAAVPPVHGAGGIPGQYGDSPVGDFYGPGFGQLDMSAVKDTTVNDRVKIQLRGEFFNVLNHPNLSMPSATWSPSGSASFGLVSNTVGTSIGFGTARQIQLALKVLF